MGTRTGRAFGRVLIWAVLGMAGIISAGVLQGVEAAPFFSFNSPTASPTGVARYWNPGPVTNQGQNGACVGYAIALWLASEPSPIQGPDGLTIWRGVLAELGRDYDSPISWQAAFQWLKTRGILTGPVHRSNDVRAAVQHIATQGPVLATVRWNTEMDNPKGGVVTTGGAFRGFHFVMCYGYAAGMFSCQNSWGPDYAEGGRFRISQEALQHVLIDIVMPTTKGKEDTNMEFWGPILSDVLRELLPVLLLALAGWIAKEVVPAVVRYYRAHTDTATQAKLEATARFAVMIAEQVAKRDDFQREAVRKKALAYEKFNEQSHRMGLTITADEAMDWIEKAVAEMNLELQKPQPEPTPEPDAQPVKRGRGRPRKNPEAAN
jgi:hypothetical protein